MPSSVERPQDSVEQPLPSNVPPLEAQIRAADLSSDTSGAGSEKAAEPDPSREARIREAAYGAYERRGKVPGREEEDWLEAERSIDAEGDGSGAR